MVDKNSVKMDKDRPSFWHVVMRGICRRCPSCGIGRLFAGYLKQVERCAVCHESIGDIRADDGPAWLTIVIVGHIMAPILLVVLPNSEWSDTVSMIVWPVVAFALILAVLPYAKGFFLAMIWRTRATG